MQSTVDTLDTQSYQPTVAFLNGEYREIYNIRERLDEYYFESHYNIDTKDLDDLETMMDYESIIYYFATEIYCGNLDSPHNNIRLWKNTTDTYEARSPYGHDRRWSWTIKDTDHGFYYRSEEVVWGYNQEAINHKSNSTKCIIRENNALSN